MNKLTYGSLAIIGLGACQSPGDLHTEKKQPNVVIFLTDDNAFWYWGFGGGPKLSPAIDSLAAEGVTCTQMYCTAPVSTPSRYSIHTGKYAGRCESARFINDFPDNVPYSIEWNTDLDEAKETTLGMIFQKAGYTTGFVGKWHLGVKDADSLFRFKPDDDPAKPEVDRKLKAYQNYMVAIVKANGFDYAASIVAKNNDNNPIEQLRYHNLDWYAKGAIDFINERAKDQKSFFLIVNITTHHGPCHEESIDQDIRVTQAGYVDELEGILPSRKSIYERIKAQGQEINFKTAGTVWTDDCVRAINNVLKKSGMESNTAVVFTSDHNRFDGKATCYQGGVHVPYIMKYPVVIKAGSRCDARIQFPDLLPSYAEMCNITLPAGLKIDGTSMWPALRGDSSVKQHDTLFFEFGYTRAVLCGDYKYIAYRLPAEKIVDMKEGKVKKAYNNSGKLNSQPACIRYPHYFKPDQLYNIKVDYEEQKNLAGDPAYRDKLNDMKSLLRRKLGSFRNPFPLDFIDAFYFTEEYKKLCGKSRILDLDKYYWYQKGCY